MKLTTTLLASAIALCVSTGCTSAEAERVARAKHTNDAASNGYLKDGPTMALDDGARLEDPTTLRLLDEKTQELARQKKKNEDLEAALAQKSAEIEVLRKDAATHAQEKERLNGLLSDATEHERAAVERALAADIARLKMEQELLRTKLGNLVGETNK